MSSCVYNRVMRILSDGLKSAKTADEEIAIWEVMCSLANAYPALHRKATNESRLGFNSSCLQCMPQ